MRWSARLLGLISDGTKHARALKWEGSVISFLMSIYANQRFFSASMCILRTFIHHFL